MIKAPTNDFVFVEKEQKTIVDDSQSISSSLHPTEYTIFDGINRDDTIKVTLSFESQTQTVYASRATYIYHLLSNKYLFQQLHVNIPIEECIFVLEDPQQSITIDYDTQKPIGEYLNDNNQLIHIRISTLLQIIKYDDQRLIKIPVPNRNVTMNEMFKSTNVPIDIYKYFASNTTKYIISNNEFISKLNERKFFLVKENETCLVSIKMANEAQLIEIEGDNSNQNQRFLIHAKIFDVYKQNKIDPERQFFLYANDFVPSLDSLLTSFLITSPIEFTILENNLPITLTIINDEHPIKFNCSNEMLIKRIFEIGCQLFNIKTKYYQLTYSDSLLDDELSLTDIDSSTTDFELRFVSKASLKCSITYADQTVVLSCDNETELSEIVKEAFIKFQISQDDIDMYQIVALGDDKTQLEFDTVMDDVLSLFSSDIATIPLELNKKPDD